jgi:hypothetical protein
MTVRKRGFPENNFQHWLNNPIIEGNFAVTGSITGTIAALTVRSAAGVPTGAPAAGEAPIAYDTTAVSGGTYLWITDAWVKVATIL